MTMPSQNWAKRGNLRGPEGPAGQKGDPGTTGATGAPGKDGAAGAQGQRGPGWLTPIAVTGGVVPDQSASIVGDLIIDTSTGDFYQRTA